MEEIIIPQHVCKRCKVIFITRDAEYCKGCFMYMDEGPIGISEKEESGISDLFSQSYHDMLNPRGCAKDFNGRSTKSKV